VIINGVNTKYLANNKLQSVKQTFFRRILIIKTPVNQVCRCFLNPVQFEESTTKRRTVQLLDVAIKKASTARTATN
jgi:hypothetical protein